jgi:hypothetical protein
VFPGLVGGIDESPPIRLLTFIQVLVDDWHCRLSRAEWWWWWRAGEIECEEIDYLIKGLYHNGSLMAFLGNSFFFLPL